MKLRNNFCAGKPVMNALFTQENEIVTIGSQISLDSIDVFDNLAPKGSFICPISLSSFIFRIELFLFLVK